jgi:MIP family channel proteins
VITAGWACAVTIAVYCVNSISGAHLNPAVTIALAVTGAFPWAQVPAYIVAQVLGGFIGGVIVWVAYFPHWSVTPDPESKLAVFSTMPRSVSPVPNFISEAIGSFMLVLAILAVFSPGNFVPGSDLAKGFGPVLVGAIVWSIGLSLGGPTGYAINPARDLGPRLAHAILPIPGKGSSDWGYSWIPILGPVAGGVLAALSYNSSGSHETHPRARPGHHELPRDRLRSRRFHRRCRSEGISQIFPPGWVEHDPRDIWSSQAGVAAEALTKAGIRADGLAAIGITNQRETAIVWDRATGEPIMNAIVWQDRRTAAICDRLRKQKLERVIRRKTGLVIDAYFSATKVQWMLQNVKGARAKAKAGQLAFGTVDSWLVWNLTGGKVHVTDVSNASRTMLFDIGKGDWDDELLEIFGVPRSMLPEVKSSSEVYGQTSLLGTPVPIAGIAGDQQAALFGQACLKPGMVKNTYGTGCFMLMNTGTKRIASKHNLLTTVAWRIGDRTEYALEGSIFIAGAVVQWLRDGLEFFRSAPEIEA